MISAEQINHIVRRSSRTNRLTATLKRVGLGLFLVLAASTAILYTRVGTHTRVYAAASNQLNFQARLLTGPGSIVSDGNYSVQFNLYNVATGGTTQWTETQGTIAIRGGYLSAYLGSVTPFPSTIDWSQQQWLTMNVNGDGEMTPRLKLTAVPNALHSNESDALRSGSNLLTADNFAQLTPTTPQVINSALAALRLNQTGAGLLAQFQGNGSDVLTIAKNGDVTSSGSATFSGGSLTLGSASATINTVANGNLTLSPNGSGVLALNTGSGGILTTNAATIQRTGATGLTLDLANAGTTGLILTNSNASNVANLSVEGGITAGTNSAFSVNQNGDITSTFQLLDGSTTTNGTSGITPPSTSLTVTSSTNFDVGNYVQISDTNCGGAGVNPCYAKITAKVGNVLTISPGLTWTTGKNVKEYHIPELGGVDTSQALANRYGRGYFISGVAAGNGTTYYNENSIDTSLTTFDLLNTGVATLNIGGAATTLNIGNASGTTTIAGTVNFSANVTGVTTINASGLVTSVGLNAGTGLIQNTGGLTTIGSISLNDTAGINTTNIGTGTTTGQISIGGGATPLVINSTNFDVSSAGALSGITTVGLSGAITGATTGNTINGLIINSGALSGISGITFASGVLNLNAGGITSTGSIAGATTISASGLVTSLGLTAGTGLIQNTGGLTSTGSISLNNTAGANTTNIGTGTTTGQISIGGGNTPLVINSTNFDVSSAGALSGITGLTVVSGGSSISGGFNNNTGGITNSGSITGVGANITGTGALTVASGGAGNLSLDSASNIIQIAASDTTLQRTAAGTYNIDLLDAAGATTLSVNNSDATQVANLSVEGDVNIGAGKLYKVGGTQISSANLSNDANIAKLNGTGPQTFTGNNKFSGTVLGVVDSATAFQVQAATGNTPVLTVDTTAKVVVVNSGSILRLAGVTSDPATPVEGDSWYNTTQKSFRSQSSVGTLGQVGILCNNTSIPAAIVNSTALTDFGAAAQCVIPANSLTAGKIIRIKARGVYGTAGGITGRNLNILSRSTGSSTVTLGQTTSVAPAAAGINNAGWEVEMYITTFTTGASGTVEAQGKGLLSSDPSTAQVRDMQNTAVITLDTTVAQTLKLSAQWGTANNNNTITLRQITYEVLN